jgi:hypothetical protein
MTARRDTRRPLVYESLYLHDPDAGNDDRLAAAIRSDGDTELWIIRPLCADCEDQAVHGSVLSAPHERLGRLPLDYRDRLGLRHRCGRTTSTGRPCRAIVPLRGMACGHHADRSQKGTGEAS